MDELHFYRSEFQDDRFYDGYYENGLYQSRYNVMSPSTPMKRRHNNVDDGEDDISDGGYFSHSPTLSHSHISERSIRCNGGCDPVCADGMRRSEGCCNNDDDNYNEFYTPRRPAGCRGFVFRHGERPMNFQRVHETTPLKNKICPTRRCFTDAINKYGHFHEPLRSNTCVKSRKRLDFEERFSHRHQDHLPYNRPHRRNLQHDLERVGNTSISPRRDLQQDLERIGNTSISPRRDLHHDLQRVGNTGISPRWDLQQDLERTGNASISHASGCAYIINNEGDSKQLCSTPLSQTFSRRQVDNECHHNSSSHSKPEFLSSEYHPVTNKHQCSCSDLQKGLLRLASSAFSNIRRKASSPESFVQFKTELDLTNAFLQQTLNVLKQIKDVCGH